MDRKRKKDREEEEKEKPEVSDAAAGYVHGDLKRRSNTFVCVRLGM
jgi:hypothetical protein